MEIRVYFAPVRPDLAALAEKAWRVLYGNGFRNTSAHEVFYESADGIYLGNSALGPQRMHALEATWETKLSSYLELATSGGVGA